MSTDVRSPIRLPVPEDLLALMRPLCRYRRIALAVSGGRDSVALMVLADAAAARLPDFPRTLVYSVDHRLRPESATECGAVAAWAERYGLTSRLLVWEGGGPSAGLQAAARSARYRLLAEAAGQDAAEAVVTGHHLEDQAETFLLRLARGSGLYGLSAMAGTTRIQGLTIERPLLAVPRARLEAMLEDADQPWCEDPSNHAPGYDRSRMRAARPVLEDIGLSAGRVALAARSLGRARAAIEHYTDRAMSSEVTAHPGGFLRLRRSGLADQPEEVGLRLLARLIRAVTVGDYGPELAKLERVLALLVAGDGRGVVATLAGCVFELHGDAVWLYREAGRRGFPQTVLGSATPVIWDRRFVIDPGRARIGGGRVRALGPDGRARVEGRFPCGVPKRAIETVPALVVDGEIRQVAGLDREPWRKDCPAIVMRHLDELIGA